MDEPTKSTTTIEEHSIANLSNKRNAVVQEDSFDPFSVRQLQHPLTNNEALAHFLKASFGTGMLSLPYAFKHAGLTEGLILTIFTAAICTHCTHKLLECTHLLYRRNKVTVLTLPQVGEAAFATGPAWVKKYATAMRVFIKLAIFFTYFGTCSVYTVIIATNFSKVIFYQTGTNINIRFYICALLLPLILLSWVPNLKMLAPLSVLANIFIGCGLGISFYYMLTTLRNSPTDLPQTGPIEELPIFFSITIFSLDVIGVIFPIENNMRRPDHFIGWFGVLHRGMIIVTTVYIFLGFFGYLNYGELTEDNITYNLPQYDIAAQMANIFIALAMIGSFALQFFVCLEIVWNALKDRFFQTSLLNEYIVRTLLVISVVAVAVAVPKIGPLLGLIGALCFALIGLVIPMVVELIISWDIGFGRYNLKLVKIILLLLFGMMAIFFGSLTNVQAILKAYM
ncbi:hypothetical protein WDU94_007569 [Cyamophila willieti]